MPRSVEELIMISHVGFGRSRDASLLWNCAVFSLFWNIWIERNSRIFKNRELSLSLLWEKITVQSSLWARSFGAFPGLSLGDLDRDWKVAIE